MDCSGLEPDQKLVWTYKAMVQRTLKSMLVVGSGAIEVGLPAFTMLSV